MGEPTDAECHARMRSAGQRIKAVAMSRMRLDDPDLEHHILVEHDLLVLRLSSDGKLKAKARLDTYDSESDPWSPWREERHERLSAADAYGHLATRSNGRSKLEIWVSDDLYTVTIARLLRRSLLFCAGE